MTASKLTVYNGALLILEQRTLDALTEEGEPRRVLDDVWDNGALDYCLSRGHWNFATRSVKINFSADFEPAFGFKRPFDKPTDWVKTSAFCSDEYYTNPLTERDYIDEGIYWYTDIDDIYVKYVSNDALWGADFSRWPRAFERVLEGYMAWQASPRIGGRDELTDKAEKKFKDALTVAASNDAQNQGSGVPKLGSWARSRLGRDQRRDRGSRSRLIG